MVRRCERPGQSACGRVAAFAASEVLFGRGRRSVSAGEFRAGECGDRGQVHAVARGADARGLIFALLDVADRVRLMPLDGALQAAAGSWSGPPTRCAR